MARDRKNASQLQPPIELEALDDDDPCTLTYEDPCT